MKSFNYKKDQDKNRSVATDSSSKNSAENSNNFEDNSAEAIQMRQFQANIDESEEVKQMKAYQDATEKHETIQAPNDDPSGSNNNTGLPDKLKTGMENQSGVSLDDVKVHRNSDKPAQLQAHAYAQGSDIYLGAGQEKHLAHELGHVVQQKKGMVKPTMQMKGKVNVNDDALLEKEADVMGQKAFQFVDSQPETNNQLPTQKMVDNSSTQEHKTIQRMQLIATEKDEREDDIIILNNIAFARQINKNKGVEKEKTGSLFESYSASDLDSEHGEIVFVHGHGMPGGFREALSEGDIKDPGDEKGILSWDKTAKIIASKLKDSDSPLTIRMMSCHGAEAGMDTGIVDPRGFVDAMVDYMGQNGVEAEVIAYNDPVISWGLLSGTSLKAGPNYDQWLKDFTTTVIKPVEIELNKLTEEQGADFDYQKRLNFVRSRIESHNIDNLIQKAISEGALVNNEIVTKKSSAISEKTIEL